MALAEDARGWCDRGTPPTIRSHPDGAAGLTSNLPEVHPPFVSVHVSIVAPL